LVPGHIWGVSKQQERFNTLYNTHYQAIYRYVLRRVGARSDAVADTVAEVFAVAWRRIDDAPAGDGELPWLYGIAYRCVLRARRSDWRRLRLLARLADEARTGSSAGGSRSREEAVREAIEQLPNRDREVLRLVMWEGLSHSEAGQVLGCSTNAVAQRLHSARERLRAVLTDPAVGSAEATATG
jgi:RNA polymerase sigma-70 factor, ECF subfamily